MYKGLFNTMVIIDTAKCTFKSLPLFRSYYSACLEGKKTWNNKNMRIILKQNKYYLKQVEYL